MRTFVAILLLCSAAYASPPSADELTAQAMDLVQRGQVAPARERLLQAAKLVEAGGQPKANGLAPRFVLGMVEALYQHDYAAAATQFKACSRVAPTNVAVLNNLAICNLHSSDQMQALRNFEAATRAGSSAAVKANLARLMKFRDKKRVVLPPSAAKVASDAVTASILASPEAAGDIDADGWLFMIIATGRTDVDAGLVKAFAGRLTDTTCLKCDGKGSMRCGKCSIGMLTVPGPGTIVGRNPVTGQSLVESSTQRVKCTACKGTGTLDCDHCNGGNESINDPPPKDQPAAQPTP